MGIFEDALKNNLNLRARSNKANELLDKIRKEFNNHKSFFDENDFMVFCAGSIGRGDVGNISDLDLFPVTKNNDRENSRLKEYEVLAKIIEINRSLGFDEFSNDGEFLKFYSADGMLDALGKPRDDGENLFTARMLLILESKPIFNSKIYDKYLNDIADNYFRDKKGKASFIPLFLVNDILRYWRTLCLNYENIREKEDKPWRKKNINLKFSRMLTVFSSILPIIALPISEQNQLHDLLRKTPLERLSLGLDVLNDETLLDDYAKFLEHYEMFLSWKEDMGTSIGLPDQKLDEESRIIAAEFSDFLYKALTHENINYELRKYILI